MSLEYFFCDYDGVRYEGVIDKYHGFYRYTTVNFRALRYKDGPDEFPPREAQFFIIKLR